MLPDRVSNPGPLIYESGALNEQEVKQYHTVPNSFVKAKFIFRTLSGSKFQSTSLQLI